MNVNCGKPRTPDAFATPVEGALDGNEGPGTALAAWRPMFFAPSNGTGLKRMRLPRVMTGFRKGPELIGKAGLTGASLLADLDAGLYLAGRITKIHKPGRPFRLMFKAVDLLR